MNTINARRSTDHGSVAHRPSPLATLRRILGLAPVTESLRSLSYWRRRPSAGKNGARN